MLLICLPHLFQEHMMFLGLSLIYSKHTSIYLWKCSSPQGCYKEYLLCLADVGEAFWGQKSVGRTLVRQCWALEHVMPHTEEPVVVLVRCSNMYVPHWPALAVTTSAAGGSSADISHKGFHKVVASSPLLDNDIWQSMLRPEYQIIWINYWPTPLLSACCLIEAWTQTFPWIARRSGVWFGRWEILLWSWSAAAASRGEGVWVGVTFTWILLAWRVWSSGSGDLHQNIWMQR